MAIMKCKMCGGDLELTAGSAIATCEYCGTTQTVPSADNEKKITLFTRANKLRFGCEFDKAAGVYEAIVGDFPEEAEAYWGLILCKYGIEYVDDPTTGKKVPTCHRSSFSSVMEDANFDLTLENADVLSRKIYREEAKQIEQIRKGIIEVSSKEDPYDIFICYKETAENGERTLDSVLAQDIYDALTEKGYRVFFSRITLEDKLGLEYEPYIFAALNSAKVMLAVGTDYEYFNAVWVKNEWSRYLKLMEGDNSRHLIPCYKNIDAYDMPKEFNKLQAQDLGKVGAIQDLLRGIDKLISAKAASVQQTAGVQSDDVKRIYLYNSAMEAMESKKIKTVKDAVKKLESLGDWNDAPAQLEIARKKLKKRKRRRRTKRFLTLFIIAAIIGGIIGLFAYQDYQTKKDRYEKAVSFAERGDYQNAYNYFVRAEDYADSPEKAAEVKELMDKYGEDLFARAERLASQGLYLTAAVYLEQSSVTRMNSMSSEAQDRTTELLNTYFSKAEESIKSFSSGEHSINSDLLDNYTMSAEAALEAGDYDTLLNIIADMEGYEVFAIDFFHKAVATGMLEVVTIDEICSRIPGSIPLVDEVIGNSGEIVDLINNQVGGK